MLILTRKPNQSIVIAGNIQITVLGVAGNQVSIGIEAPKTINIAREELLERNGEELFNSRNVVSPGTAE